MPAVPNDILAVLRRAGLLDFGDEPAGEPLTGGVSSDIWLVRLRHRAVCVKRALAQLRVKADWRAPVERSGYEAAWMRVAGAIGHGLELLDHPQRGDDRVALQRRRDHQLVRDLDGSKPVG